MLLDLAPYPVFTLELHHWLEIVDVESQVGIKLVEYAEFLFGFISRVTARPSPSGDW
jgi:hypothetical protein